MFDNYDWSAELKRLLRDPNLGQVSEAVRAGASEKSKVFAAQREMVEATIREKWSESIARLDTLHAFAVDYGGFLREAAHAERGRSGRATPATSRAVMSIQARACLTTGEIRTLIVAGHASGAMTRWRTLRELLATAGFLLKFGDDAAQRWMDHRWVTEPKWVDDLARAAGPEADESIPEEVRSVLKERRANLVKQYGTTFLGSNGWAAEALGKRRKEDKVAFWEIERASGIGDFKDMVKIANDAVHAGFRLSQTDLGRPLAMGEGSGELLGASAFGLEVPLLGTAYTLGHMTSFLSPMHQRTLASEAANPAELAAHIRISMDLALAVGEAAQKEATALASELRTEYDRWVAAGGYQASTGPLVDDDGAEQGG